MKAPDLTELKGIHLPGTVEAMAPTPSGDRVYVALHDSPKIVVLDRYSESLASTIDLPGPATDLRTDPLGKMLLAKPANGGDSAWVIDIGTARLIGSVGTRWTTDLPAFAPSSTIATVQGPDVVFVDGTTLNSVRRVAGGAKDYWYFFYWNGFRPRPADLDQPVTFNTPDTTPRDTTTPLAPVQAPVDSNRPAPPLRDAKPTILPPVVLPPPAAIQRPSAGFLVSFAAVLSDQRAQEVAATVEVGGNERVSFRRRPDPLPSIVLFLDHMRLGRRPIESDVNPNASTGFSRRARER